MVPVDLDCLSLHDALPICDHSDPASQRRHSFGSLRRFVASRVEAVGNLRRGAEQKSMALLNWSRWRRSEEHTSELQSRPHLVCRLQLEKKNTCRRSYVMSK